MANYTGNIITPLISVNKAGIFVPSLFKNNQIEMSTTRYNDGAQSLKIIPGGSKDVFIVCEAGSRTLTVQVWPNANSDKCGLILYDPDAGMDEQLDADWSTGSGAWEELSITFTAVAKVYIARLINSAAFGVANAEAWFDTLAVT